LYTDPHAKPGTAQPRKFMFERSFDDASVVHRTPERKPVLMKPEQIDALRKEGFDAGFEAGKSAGKEEQTVQLNALLAIIDQNMSALMQKLDALAREQEMHARQLVLSVAKKILPDFAARHGLAEIDALLGETIREMAREPRLVVRISEDQFDAVNERVQEIAKQRAYPGKVIVLADPEVVSGDCRVEWADGGIERNTQATWRAVENTIHPVT
jgi:flagellar assembly protein FliH